MSQGSHQNTPPPCQTSTSTSPCILPIEIQNSLLMRYDPIRLLSRPSLLATVDRKRKSCLSSPTKVSLPSSTASSSTTTFSPGGKRQVQDGGGEVKSSQDGSLMPPPRYPLPATATTMAVATTSRAITVEQLEETASTSKSRVGGQVGGVDESHSYCSKRVNVGQRRSLPYIYPKLDLVPRKRTKVARYVDEEQVNEGEIEGRQHCSAKKLRLSTASFAFKQCSIGIHINQMARLKLIKYTQTAPSSSGGCNSNSESAKSQSHAQSSRCIAANNSSATVSKVGRKHHNMTEHVPMVKKDKVGIGRVGGKKTETATIASSNLKPARRKISSKYRDVPSKIPENHLVNHTIELLRHKRELQTRLELIEEEGVVHRIDDLPKLKQPIPKGQLTIPNIPLTGRQTKEIIQKRLPILLAHEGYTHANQQPMEVLADVFESFYVKMAHRLKQVREMEMSGCEQEFPDPLERVMVEMNLGGVRGVEKFYNSRVVDYRKRVEDQCIYLRKLYAHKIRLKVGMVTSSTGGNYTSSTTSTSSQLISPGNSVLTDILSGLEGPMGSYNLFDQEEKIRQLNQQMRPPQQILSTTQPPQPLISNPNSSVSQEIRFNHPQQQTAQLKQPIQVQPPSQHQPLSVPSYSNSSSLPPNQNQSPIRPTSLGPPTLHPQQNPSTTKSTPSSKQIQHPQLRLETQHQKASPPSPVASKTRLPSNSSQVISSPSTSFPNSMVSINLNNNVVDLGGFVPTTSPTIASRTPTLNVNKGIITCGTGDSKAKLKEALSQRNLLRLNFEQVPSSCDSTVLLSSSSPSLSSNTSLPANKANTASSSLSQTTRLKL